MVELNIEGMIINTIIIISITLKRNLVCVHNALEAFPTIRFRNLSRTCEQYELKCYDLFLSVTYFA